MADAHHASSGTVAASCICLNLRKAARAVTQLYDDALRPSGLRATQFSLLAAVDLAGPVPVTGLAEALVMDRTTLTRNLGTLARDGMVAIRAGRDRRTRLVELRPRGRTALRRALPLWERAQATLTARAGGSACRTLVAQASAVAGQVRWTP